MAKLNGVWGIDIGQAAFKALRCTTQGGEVVADAFDYIEYPKILSQPEAEPEKMIREAIAQFLTRNDLKGCRVALAVPGQSGLAKFFKPPPVDAKKIPEIVKYEARQQIPFALEDVIWDFQQMGGAEEDGFAVETEVGLFAMKREQVYRAMKPFQDADLELDIIQLAPLSIYNFVTYDILGAEANADDYDPENPPASLVVLSMGTDTTDLVITNGFRVWQRSVPLGGNHFTKQLTKELKLTFAKAEHLKRNARQAEDPKLVFQAMRPVFNDLVTEVQRSIGYFQGIDRKAKIGGVVVLGNAVKLPGLQQYLAKNLGYDVRGFESFAHLKGPAVVSSPAFKDNQLSFGVCYGLCLQGLGVAKLRTNLVPREIVTDRLVRAKKPWAVASVAALLLACTFNVFFHYGNLRQVAEDRAVANITWKDATARIESASSTSSRYEQEDKQLVDQLGRITAIGEELVGNADRRVLWMEMLKAVNSALPQTPGVQPGEIPDVQKVPFDQRQEIHVERVDTQFVDSLSDWFTEPIKASYFQHLRSLGMLGTGDGSESGTASSGDPVADIKGPEGAGWIIQMQCYHYFNKDRSREGIAHVLNTLIYNLMSGVVILPVPVEQIRPGVVLSHQVQDRLLSLRVTELTPTFAADAVTGAETVAGYQLKLEGVETPIPVPRDGSVPVVFTMAEMGIGYPVVVMQSPINQSYRVPNPNFELPETGTPGSSYGGFGASKFGAGAMGAGPLGAPAGLMSDMVGPGMMGMPYAGSRNVGGQPGGSTSGKPDGKSDGKSEENEPQEPPYLTVPRFDFTVQLVWKETLLSERLEKQAKEWQEKAPAGTTAGNAELAVNTGGGT
ncbi:MAG: type IV pilus assembly protein PilM [Pirellulaceae bacterium]|jgi:type IV pilus assembly protein PilM|nr:type IV pilus assembly protein PilM [Pirellulaceae bacterium]